MHLNDDNKKSQTNCSRFYCNFQINTFESVEQNLTANQGNDAIKYFEQNLYELWMNFHYIRLGGHTGRYVFLMRARVDFIFHSFDVWVSYFIGTQMVCMHLFSEATQGEERTANLTSTSQLCHVVECQKVTGRAGNCTFKQTILIRVHPGSCRAKPPLVCQFWFIKPGGIKSEMRTITGSTEEWNHKTEWEKREWDKEENNQLALLSRIQYLDIPA